MVRAPSSRANPLSACIPTKRRTNSAEGSKSQSSAALHAAVSSSSRGAKSAAAMFRRSTTRWSGDSSHAAIAAYIMSGIDSSLGYLLLTHGLVEYTGESLSRKYAAFAGRRTTCNKPPFFSYASSGKAAKFDSLLVGHLAIVGGRSSLVEPAFDESGWDELPRHGFRDFEERAL